MMRKKITGEEAAIALLKGEKIFYGTETLRWANGQLMRRVPALPAYWVGLAGRNISEVLNWTGCEVEVPDEPAKPAAPPKFTCPVCGSAITEWKREWVNGVRVLHLDWGAFTEKMGPDDLTITGHCDSCGANIVTQATHYPKPERPKLPGGMTWTSDGGIFDPPNSCIYMPPKTKRERDSRERTEKAYSALVELWDRENSAKAP